MTRTLGNLLVLFACWWLAACGFQPLYGTKPSGTASEILSGIEVAPISDRLGQQVRNQLIDRLSPRGIENKRFDLAVDLNSKIDGFGFRADRSVTREELTLTATYQLADAISGEMVFAKQAVARVSYDVVQSDFAYVQTQRDAQERAAAQLVENIVRDLAVYFQRRDPSPATP